MKAQSVKTKIKQLIKKMGSRKAVAAKLEVHLSYIYWMENGKVPGDRLYRDICNLCKEYCKITYTHGDTYSYGNRHRK